jgi:nucleoside-diphosphate-sugar epimerase
MTTDAPSCLIGHTGFVGGSLLRQAAFDETYNSRNFRDMAGRRFSEVVCCGVSAVKWLANKEPEADKAAIRSLADVLLRVRADRFVLVSTVDVYPLPDGVDEACDIDPAVLHPYGRHRLWLERVVRDRFPEALVLRLPALFGEGLKKNVLFDMMRGERLSAIDPGSAFQWYDVERLWRDVGRARAAKLRLVNLAVEPVSTADVAAALFPALSLGQPSPVPTRYDVRTRHAEAFGGPRGYTMSAAESLWRMSAFVASAGASA